MDNEPRTAERTPLLSEQANGENATLQSNPNPLELGAIPTIPTLPTSSASTLQVGLLILEKCFSLSIIKFKLVKM